VNGQSPSFLAMPFTHRARNVGVNCGQPFRLVSRVRPRRDQRRLRRIASHSHRWQI
jgi:hypothetical protein